MPVKKVDVEFCVEAKITKEQYSSIMQRWSSGDMMAFDFPLHVDKKKFYWNTHRVNFNSSTGKKIMEELVKLGIPESEIKRIEMG